MLTSKITAGKRKNRK